MIEVGLSEKPVYRDGLTTSLSYLFVAVKQHEQHNCVVWAPGLSKLKFYPNAQFWGVTEAVLSGCGISRGLYNRADYQGVTGISKDQMVKVMNVLRNQRSTVVVDEQVFKSFNFQADVPRTRCREQYPQTSRVPVSLPQVNCVRAKL